ncbi:CNP1-like family protein [Chitinasiproducens palmae]|uniref:CNP1-like family protein n=1 Tax=Chitinasiproducens palmae TaxID=1770053 RepID=A0A1H2PRN9_9BURK|nr:CNP1-like family protein [Chitinasiproducens palmae]SDV49563.1 CNP1-like family protein [Chitinasiproducens palmae]
MKRFLSFPTGAALLVTALACATASAQDRAEPPAPASTSATNGGLFDALLERTPDWHEQAIGALPPLPREEDLLPFTVSNLSRFKYSLDARSLTVGKDGVIRYVVVIETPAGARNVRYEGIHCAGSEWRLYSGANEAGTAWDGASTPWLQIEPSNLNAYHAALSTAFFCDNRMPADNAQQIVRNVRYNRTISDRDYR